MNPAQIMEMAQFLDESRQAAREVSRITDRHPELSMSDAYAIQEAGIRLRQARGERVVAYKMGLTSRAKREQMGLKSPCYGVLTDRMQVPADGVFPLQGSIHPKIEPEIAFVVSRELRGKVGFEQAAQAIESVFPALEILDSRFVGFKYFSLPDVVADNSSSSHFVIPAPEHRKPFRGMDPAAMANWELVLSINGARAQAALASEISGHPIHSLIQLCELLEERGQALPAGSIVLTGAATAAVALEPGMRVQLEVAGLGALGVSVSA